MSDVGPQPNPKPDHLEEAFKNSAQQQQLIDEERRRLAELQAVGERLTSALNAIKHLNISISLRAPTTTDEKATVVAELVAGWTPPLVAMGKLLRDETLTDLLDGLNARGENAGTIGVAIFQAAVLGNAGRVDELLTRGFGGGEILCNRLNEFLRRYLPNDIWQTWAKKEQLISHTTEVTGPDPNANLGTAGRED